MYFLMNMVPFKNTGWARRETFLFFLKGDVCVYLCILVIFYWGAASKLPKTRKVKKYSVPAFFLNGTALIVMLQEIEKCVQFIYSYQ